MNGTILIVLVLVIAFAYAMVGHGGASGYLALLALVGTASEVMKPTALLLNLCVSLISFTQFFRAGHFRWRMFWPFALLSVPCAFIAAGFQLDDRIYGRLLAACIVIAALRLLGVFGAGEKSTLEVPVVPALLIGAVIGSLSGLLGIGGGVLLSPVLLMCGWANAKTAAATSALFIFVNSAAGLLNVRSIPVAFTQEMLLWTGAAVCGGLLGSWVGARKAPEPRLRQALGIVLLLASIKLFWP